jgi:hypothetical protein
MKKLFLVVSVIAMVGFTSCSKYKDCQCTYSALGVSVTAPVVDASYLEQAGLTCSEYEDQQTAIYPGIQCVEQ